MPVAITAITAADIQRRNIVSVQDIQRQVPSLQSRQVASSRDQISFRLRGQGQSIAGSLPAVVAYFEDVPTNAAGPGLLYDLESIQILKGPQGTLFGRNTTGGAILLNPRRPDGELGGSIDLTAGNYGLRRAQGALNVPISDSLKIRFAFDSNQRNGFTKDLGTGADLDDRNYFGWRVGILLTPVEGLENYFVYDRYRSRSNGGSVVLLDIRPGSLATTLFPGITGDLVEQRRRGKRIVEFSTLTAFDDVDTESITNVLTYKVSDQLSLKNILGYRMSRQRFTGDSDATRFPIIEERQSPEYHSGSYSNPQSQKAVTAELQAQASLLDKQLSLILGIYYENIKPESSSNIDETIQFGNRVSLATLRYDRSKAVFGQATADLSRLITGLRFTGGVRYTVDNRRIRAKNVSNGVCTTVLADANCFREIAAKFSEITYNISAEYQPTDSTLIYLAHRKGYKSGGFNPGVALGLLSVFGPERVRDAELGIKTDFRLASMPVRLNLAGYVSKLTDIQRTRQVLANGQSFTATGNEGSANINGIEVEFSAVPVDGVRLSSFYSYTDAGYNLPALKNTPFTITPKHKFGVSGSYKMDLGEGVGTITPFASYSYQSLTHTSNTPDFRDVQKGYGILDARIDWDKFLDTPVSVYVFANNITKRSYLTTFLQFYNGIGFSAGAFGEPRMFGAGVKYGF
ncbi:TonB-dependent receptor [Sphingomonas sp. SRS2]|uniref:TonB-dependent receptor n=1 Tax=Sphingomonas sp. SRS2 TaxID=133190 RepID=UPI001364CDC5|nr:TonB-dependent receptor [Sphingomonas sp. SRS2]